MYYDIEKSSRRIKELRLANQRTQEAVAGYIRISLDGYRKLERGVNGAKVDTLVAIAELYGVSLDYLVYGQKDNDGNVVVVNLSEKEKDFMQAVVKCIKENIGLLT